MLDRISRKDVPSDIPLELSFDDIEVKETVAGVSVMAKADTKNAYRPLTLPRQLFECLEGKRRVAIFIYCSPQEFLGARILNNEVLELYFRTANDNYYILKEDLSRLRTLAAEMEITVRFADYY